MSTSKAATEEGFNGLMKEQAKVEGQALVTLAQFDSFNTFGLFGQFTQQAIRPHWGEPAALQGYKPEFVYRMQDITSVPKLDLQPRGGTPLLDCLGEFINEVGRDLAKMREQDRPGTVILVVLTDGEENSSRVWNSDKVKALITQQESTYKWKFLFLGANMDAVETGAGYGVARGASMTYDDSSPVAVASAFASTSNLMSSYRSGNISAAYSDSDRSAAK